MSDKDKKLLHGFNFDKDSLKDMCVHFSLPVSGNKPDLVARLTPKVSPKMASLLDEHEKAHLPMKELRQLADPLGLKSTSAFALQIGLAANGVGPSAMVYASSARSPSGQKPKSAQQFHGVAPANLFSESVDAFEFMGAPIDPALMDRAKFLPQIDSFTVNDLKDICRINDINGFSYCTKKADLVDFIKKHYGVGPASENARPANAPLPPSQHEAKVEGKAAQQQKKIDHPCKFFLMGCCNKGAECRFLHPVLTKLALSPTLHEALVRAGNVAFKSYYSKPYLPMPKDGSYEGEPYVYYQDWDDWEGIERPNHGLASAMRKALLIKPVIDAHGFSKELSMDGGQLVTAMHIAMIFEVVGRESEVGYRDCPDTYMRYKAKSIRAFVEYGAQSNVKPEYITLCKNALENMYYEPRTHLEGMVSSVFETVHELDLFRCYPDGQMRTKVAEISKKVGGNKNCLELVLRAENGIVATGDRLTFSLVGHRVRDDYCERRFPRCSTDAAHCLDCLLGMPLLPPSAKKTPPAEEVTKPPPAPPPAPVPPPPAPKPVTKPMTKPMTKPPTATTSKVAGSFEQRFFLKAYSDTQVPTFASEVMEAVRKLIHGYAEQNKDTIKGDPRTLMIDYFRKVQNNLFDIAGSAEFRDSPQALAVRMWTTAERTAEDRTGLELCGILNKALRDDDPKLMEHVCIFTRALNMQMVSRTKNFSHVKWPSSNRTYRGTALPICHRDFFTVGKTYRVPMYLATSADDDVAEEFMQRLAPPSAAQEPAHQEPTMWIFHFDKEKRCKHVNFIDKTDGSASGENEFLFVPYSIFKVRKATWVDKPRVNDMERRYHTIEIDVAPDNIKGPMAKPDLPLAPWA